jgi:two-component system, NtrC family, sensor histidine kinase GlrK
MARMRRLLPKSLNGYLLLGLGVFTLPLLAAIAHATFQLQRLTASGQHLVLESVQVTRLSQDLYEQLAQLERTARLYAVVGDPQLLAAYDSRDAELGTLLGELRAALPSDEARAALGAMQHSRGKAGTAMHGEGDTTPAEGIATVAQLGEQASRIAALINAGIDAELADLGARTDAARRELLLEAGLLLPLALAAVLSFYFGISRPIREVDRAITELGGGNFARPIAVRGPSDLQRLGAQLEWLRHRLLELAQERNRFLRHMSHELKTPLANLREGTELLMEGAVGELGSGQREVTAILQENSIKLQRMIENLLSFSAWQSNNTGLDLSEFPLRPLVRQVLENQQLTLVSQRVRLDVQVQDIVLGADRGKLRLILENLLSNAIKYSPRGGTIWVRARVEGDSCVLEVADAGAGIPQQERPGVFEAFQTGRAPSGHIRGTGIGLSVVHEFVQVHRGRIDIVDGEFPGAHFRIRLPLRSSPRAHAA